MGIGSKSFMLDMWHVYSASEQYTTDYMWLNADPVVSSETVSKLAFWVLSSLIYWVERACIPDIYSGNWFPHSDYYSDGRWRVGGNPSCP